MKELYTKPELEIELFETEDIITTSDGDVLDGDNEIGYSPGWGRA